MIKSMLLSVIVAAAFVSAAQAQTTVVTPPPAAPPGAVVTTPGSVQMYTGTVTQVDPTSRTLILTSPTSPAPVTYTFAPDTVFVDQQGNTVSYDAVRNAPVKVEYTSDGGRTIVRRVIVVH